MAKTATKTNEKKAQKPKKGSLAVQTKKEIERLHNLNPPIAIPPRNIGCPTKYRPEYCDMLIDHMSAGYSFESFSAIVKTNRDTLFEWAKVHPAFSDAKRNAYDENLLFWEKAGIENLRNYGKESSFNSTVWVFNLKNRHNWRDNRDVVVQKEVTFTHKVKEELAGKSIDELIAIAKGGE